MSWHDPLRIPVKESEDISEVSRLYRAILENIAINTPKPKPPPKPVRNAFLQPEGMAEREPSWRLDASR